MPFRTEVRSGLIWTEFEEMVVAADLREVALELARLERDLPVMPGHLADLRRVRQVEFGYPAVLELARGRRERVFPNAFRSAIVVASQEQLGFARMFQILNDHPMITLAVFREIEAACAWLAEPGPGADVVVLDHADAVVAAEILGVMHASYAVEASLLGVTDFFPLRRTIEQVRTAPCAFHGVREHGRLLAVAEVDEHSADRPNVDALVVHPDAFRRGLGTALMRRVIAQQGARGLTVSTGERNEPAVALYERLGFAIERRWLTDDGIAMVTLGLLPRCESAT